MTVGYGSWWFKQLKLMIKIKWKCSLYIFKKKCHRKNLSHKNIMMTNIFFLINSIL